MKQGLLFKDAPEPRAEFFCWEHKILFDDENGIITHYKTEHDFHNEWRVRQALERMNKRPVRRFLVTREEIQNLKEKKCWCGKPKDQWESKYQRKYCSPKHQDVWMYEKIPVWNWYRDRYISNHRKENNGIQYCDNCSVTSEVIKYDYRDGWEVDHIIAIMNGGHPWDDRNLQVLCHDCHVEKTLQDFQVRKESAIMVLDE